eukprot:1509879-Prorocentrum_lima.AAC.1
MRANEIADEVETRARIQTQHILQHLPITWQWCLVIQPHYQLSKMTVVTDAALAPGGGRSREV